MRRILSALAVASLGFFAIGTQAVQSHTNQYYPASMCKAVDEFGRHTNDIRFENGGARNRNDSSHRFLICPVPLRTPPNNPITVRVRVFDNSGDAAVRFRVCEGRDADGSTTCSPFAQTGVSERIGLTVLQSTFSPTSETRWVFLSIELPDGDSTGGNGILGYRVCQGGC